MSIINVIIHNNLKSLLGDFSNADTLIPSKLNNDGFCQGCIGERLFDDTKLSSSTLKKLKDLF